MKRTTVITLAALFSLTTFLACYWDHDTLQMETSEFPGTLDLITGNFLRHSPEFYVWRVQDREQKLQQYPDSLSLYDDLSVAYSKLGNDEKAIQVALRKDSLKPGLYETYANLGTFYIHNNQLEKGIENIDKAIEINPDAHFGREIYQRYLAEYILTKKDSAGLRLPLDTIASDGYDWREKPDNFYNFLLSKHNEDRAEDDKNRVLPRKQQEKAVEGILGMMKFGNFDSPILLEVLGDMLLSEFDTNDQEMDQGARRLAFLAYAKASRVVEEPAKGYYERKAAGAIFNQKFEGFREDDTKAKVEHMRKVLDDAIARANEFYEEIRQNEIKWISEEKNPQDEFDAEYYGIDTPALKADDAFPEAEEDNPELVSNTLLYVIIGLAVLLLGGFVFRKIVPKS